MTQLSLFSADLAGPAVDDLAGLLAAHGQLVTSAGATRISVVVAQAWRAEGLAVLVRECGVGVETEHLGEGRALVRSSASAALTPLHAAWTKGAVKAVPVGWAPGGRALRAWMLAAGRPDDAGFVLGLTRTPPTHTSRWRRRSRAPGWPRPCWVPVGAAPACA